MRGKYNNIKLSIARKINQSVNKIVYLATRKQYYLSEIQWFTMLLQPLKPIIHVSPFLVVEERFSRAGSIFAAFNKNAVKVGSFDPRHP